MRASNFLVLEKMEVQCSFFKLLLFQLLVVWCAAKHITIDNSIPRLEFASEDADVQDSIKNFMYTGE